MANEQRLRSNLQFGTISDNPLTTTTTVINSPQFATLPAVDTTSHLPIVLNPTEVAVPGTSPEIVYITAHTSGATVATVVRAREGTTASGYNSTATWIHGPLVSDHAPTIVDTSGSLPSSGGLPYAGQIAYMVDTKTYQFWNGTAWQDLLNSGAWTAWTPTLTGNGWALGNGTATGKYRKVGRTVTVVAEIILGSTSSKGSGTATMGGLPFATASSPTTWYGEAKYTDTSTGAVWEGAWKIAGGATSGGLYADGFIGSAGNIVLAGIDSNTPLVWATLDVMHVQIVYEATS